MCLGIHDLGIGGGVDALADRPVLTDDLRRDDELPQALAARRINILVCFLILPVLAGQVPTPGL